MGAVHIRIGHDDDALVAERACIEAGTGPAAERLDQIVELLVAAQLIGAGTGDVEDLAAQRQHCLGLAVARLLGGAARGIALDQEYLGAIRRPARAIGELARQSGLTGRALTGDFAVLPAPQTLLGSLDDAV